MNVLVVSGIWPPDVGGPASHAPDVAAWLQARGHAVEVVTTAGAPPDARPYPVHWASRRLPKGLIHLRTAGLIRARARRADVVYTTGMFGRSSAGAVAARRPFVVKLTADPAFERARRRGVVGGEVEEFQGGGGGLQGRLLRLARDAELRRAAHVFCPSAWLRELAVSWGVPAERVSVLPNPSPPPRELPDRDELKRRLGVNGATLAFAGRLTAQKSLGVAVEAVASAEGVELLVAGEGPDREPLERLARELGIAERVRFLGPQPRERVLELFRAADAAILSSSWENFPHTVVEALTVGTPVLATRAGGVAEVVEHERNGLLVDQGDAQALGAAIRRFFGDAELRERLRAAAAPSVAAYAPDRVFGELEATLERVARRYVTRPRVLFVGRTRYRLPLEPGLRKKWDALAHDLDVHVLGSAAAGSPTRDGTFTLVPPLRPRILDGVWFHASLPVRAARELRRFRPDAVVAQSPYEAAAVRIARVLARSEARLVLDVHADWRTSTRLYGSPFRRALAPLGDRVARSALQGADGVRTISGYTTGLVREVGVEPAGVFPAFMDLEPFAGPPRPLPERPAALFVGVLERYKNVDGLADAWRLAAPEAPGASLHVVGRGTLTDVVERLVAELPERTRWTPVLAPDDVAAALDGAWALLLPSRSEGLGRVVIEAFCRGRPVIATSVGGIRDLVEDGVNGLLVPPGDTEALAGALVRVLTDRELAERLGEGARRSAEAWLQTPEQYAARVRELVERVTAA